VLKKWSEQRTEDRLTGLKRFCGICGFGSAGFAGNFLGNSE
jgi:hypothetical protein